MGCSSAANDYITLWERVDGGFPLQFPFTVRVFAFTVVPYRLSLLVLHR